MIISSVVRGFREEEMYDKLFSVISVISVANYWHYES